MARWTCISRRSSTGSVGCVWHRYFVSTANKLIEAYSLRRPKSVDYFERARQVLGGRVGHDLRYFQPMPLYIEYGKGGRKWDVDGNEYVDFLLGNGALLLGHAVPEVLEAITQAAARGRISAMIIHCRLSGRNSYNKWCRRPSACVSSTRGPKRPCWHCGWHERIRDATRSYALRGIFTAGTMRWFMAFSCRSKQMALSAFPHKFDPMSFLFLTVISSLLRPCCRRSATLRQPSLRSPTGIETTLDRTCGG